MLAHLLSRVATKRKQHSTMSPSNSKTKRVPKRKAAKGALEASKKGRVAPNKTIGHRGRLKDSNGCYTSYDEDDNNFNDNDSSLDDDSPQQQVQTVPSKPASTQAAKSSTGQAALQKEYDALRTKLHMATRHAKMKQLINEEDEMVVMKLRRFVKEQLWKKVKFITDDNVLDRALQKCIEHFRVDEREQTDWKLRMLREVQQSINNRRNN